MPDVKVYIRERFYRRLYEIAEKKGIRIPTLISQIVYEWLKRQGDE